MNHPDRLHPDEIIDLRNRVPDDRSDWQIIRQHWTSFAIGGAIGALALFPGLQLAMAALEIFAEVLK